jgi:hypothetical protein
MRNHLGALLFSIAIVAASFILAGAYKTKFTQQQTIAVTGLSEYDFESDLVVWNGNFSRRNSDMKTAYAQLKSDENAIRDYLKSQGVTDAEMIFSSVNILKDYDNYRDASGNYYNRFIGYNLQQDVKIESKNLNKIEKVSREITQLIDAGVELNSQEPQYYYTKLSELKIELLAKASADARARAETISNNSKAKLGKLIKANMGVFQITGQNSNEDYTYGGAFNTVSRKKTASITIKMEFATK